MTAVLNIILLALVAIAVLLGLYFIVKGFSARTNIHREAYNVGQTEARRQVRINWIRGLVFLFLGLIFLGLFALRPLVLPADSTPVAEGPTPGATATIETAATPTLPAPTAEPSPTVQAASPTPEPTAAPTDTPTPQTAVVSSGVGVWLRGAPSTAGEQLEWLLDGTLVTLLPQQQTADELLWQQVETDGGQVGWVAYDFLLIGAQPTIAPPAETTPAGGESTPEPTPEV